MKVFAGLAWWLIFAMSVVFASYAAYHGIAELMHQLGLGPMIKYRATPMVFVIHALTGSVVLGAGPLQFSGWLRRRKRLHRGIGKAYVVGVWIAGASAIFDAPSFDVVVASRIVFVVTAGVWLAATTVAFRHIQRRRIAAHREWMIRSFALSFFFVTGGVWMEVLANTSLPADVAHPLSLLLAGSLNLITAEIWIHSTRSSGRAMAHAGLPT